MTDQIRLSDLEFESLFAAANENYGLQPDGSEVCDPLLGNLYRRDDADRLIDSLEFAKQVQDAVHAWQRKLRELIAALTSGTAKTRRVKGQRRLAKVEMPGESWDNAILKEAWNAYPALRDDLLRISRVDVKLREFRKAVNTSGPADYETLVKIIQSAQREPAGIPTVTIEE